MNEGIKTLLFIVALAGLCPVYVTYGQTAVMVVICVYLYACGLIANYKNGGKE